MSEEFDQVFWDERYRSHGSLWSGDPNPYLLSEATGLEPGAALDIGCGEGADAIWLARRRWQVTAVDVSPVALERAAAHAKEAGVEGIDWVRADLAGWDSGGARYDLVTAHYIHLPTGVRGPLFRRLAASVTAGGTLLVVAHHLSDQETTVGRPRLEELYFSGDEILSVLDPEGWEVVTNAAVPRPATDPEGRAITINDMVLVARARTTPGRLRTV